MFSTFVITNYILSFHSVDTQQFGGMSTYFPEYMYLLSRLRVHVFRGTKYGVRGTGFPATPSKLFKSSHSVSKGFLITF